VLTDAGGAAGDERRHAGLELHLAGAGGVGWGCGAGEGLLPRRGGGRRRESRKETQSAAGAGDRVATTTSSQGIGRLAELPMPKWGRRRGRGVYSAPLLCLSRARVAVCGLAVSRFPSHFA
jgi:hypothetical protein